MGLPSWKKNGIEVVGHNVVGSPTWESCSRKIPDLNCITRCLGRKVIENVKANNKQTELQVNNKQIQNILETPNSLTIIKLPRLKIRWKMVSSTIQSITYSSQWDTFITREYNTCIYID